jgi:zinc protease
MKRLLTVSLLLIVAFAHADAPPNLKRVVLPNGLTLLAVEDQSGPVAGMHLAARYDPAGIGPRRAGVAALSQQVLQLQLSDMLYEDAWQELGRQLRGTRASLSANTETDYCEIRGKVTDDVLAQAVQLAGKLLLGHQPIAPEQLQYARDILLAGQKDNRNSVIEETYYCFMRALLGRRSPLAQPVQGSEEALKALTANDLVAFRATYMVPNNAVLTLIASRPLRDLVDLATLAMGQYSTGGTTVPVQTATASPQPRLCVAQQNGWRGVSLMVGVATPAYGTPDFLKAQLVYTLLEGKGGRLAEDAVLRAGLGANHLVGRGQEPPSVTVLPPMAQPRPVLILHMVMAPRQMELARQELLKHFQILQSEPPTALELDRAKRRLINSYARLRLDHANLAKALSCYELYGGDVNLAWQVDSQIQAVTGPDLMALAKQWFGSHAIGVLMPGDE